MNNKEFKNNFKKRLYVNILNLLNCLKTYDWRDPVVKIIKNQLIRSSTSVGANYFEAIAGSSKNDFKKFIYYSLKSANETQYWIILLRDFRAEADKLEEFLREFQEISNILGASLKTMNNS